MKESQRLWSQLPAAGHHVEAQRPGTLTAMAGPRTRLARKAFLLALPVLVAADALAAGVKVGIIGLRHGHAWRQLSEVTEVEEADFVGVAESIKGLVEEARKIQPAAHFESGYREFVRSRMPEIVWAFVENNRHLEMVEFLAPLGIHVIFEKPLAGSYADAVRIQELAREHGVEVMTNYQMAWWPSNHELKRQAEAGKIGRVWRLHGVFGNGGPSPRNLRSRVFFDWLTDPEANGAGPLVDFGIYSAAWAAWHLGLPSRVYAAMHSFQPKRFPKVEDNAVMVLSYPHAVGIFEGSWNLPRGFKQLEIFGHEGSLAMDWETLALRAARNAEVEIEPAPLDSKASHPVRYMIDRITTGQPLEHIVALDLNVSAVRILEAAKLSAREGRAVPLPPAAGGR